MHRTTRNLHPYSDHGSEAQASRVVGPSERRIACPPWATEGLPGPLIPRCLAPQALGWADLHPGRQRGRHGCGGELGLVWTAGRVLWDRVVMSPGAVLGKARGPQPQLQLGPPVSAVQARAGTEREAGGQAAPGRRGCGRHQQPGRGSTATSSHAQPVLRGCWSPALAVPPRARLGAARQKAPCAPLQPQHLPHGPPERRAGLLAAGHLAHLSHPLGPEGPTARSLALPSALL